MAGPEGLAPFHRVCGRVCEAHRGRAIIELEIDPREAGSGPECAACRLCSPAGSGRVELRASVPAGMELRPGERVEVEIRRVAPHKAALLLYGMPLAVFLAASLGVWAATGSENGAALAGFGGLAAAFLMLFLVERGRGPGARVVGSAGDRDGRAGPTSP